MLNVVVSKSSQTPKTFTAKQMFNAASVYENIDRNRVYVSFGADSDTVFSFNTVILTTAVWKLEEFSDNDVFFLSNKEVTFSNPKTKTS